MQGINQVKIKTKEGLGEVWKWISHRQPMDRNQAQIQSYQSRAAAVAMWIQVGVTLEHNPPPHHAEIPDPHPPS